MSYIPRIDEFSCAAHGDCVQIAPTVFRIDDELSVAVVIGTDSDDLIMEAAEACPAAAITIVDSDTVANVYP
ncbi:MAG: ferredoxin [Thermoleophilia bacterium]|nr:ferredoxin [Thermoleophilia bacterium]